MPTSTNDFDAEALYKALLAKVRAGLQGVPDAAIVGIHSGGAWLAERLAADLQRMGDIGKIVLAVGSSAGERVEGNG